MAQPRAGQPYEWLARYYDQFFAAHRPWYQRARRVLLGKILRQLDSACDLACGTGATALALARRGAKVFAVDLSPVMCRLTREKARRAGLPIRVLRADMRSFRLPQPVELVTCEYDAVNHLPRKADLIRVARAVARALRPGGYFYFDVNNRKALQTIWQGAWWEERPGVVLVVRARYNRRRDKGWIVAEWFVREARRWRRFSERIQEVCWTSAEIRRTLRLAGFKQIRSWDATPFFRAARKIAPGCRTFYLARRSPGGPHPARAPFSGRGLPQSARAKLRRGQTA